MLKIHTSNGQTHKIDMLDEKLAKEWTLKLRSRDFQSTITGISVVGSAGSRVRCPCCDKTDYLHCNYCNSSISKDFRTSVGVQYSMTKPDGYAGAALFVVENIANNEESRIRGGERVTCFAGDARIQMMIHAGQPSMRLAVSRVGHQRFSPFIE